MYGAVTRVHVLADDNTGSEVDDEVDEEHGVGDAIEDDPVSAEIVVKNDMATGRMMRLAISSTNMNTSQ